MLKKLDELLEKLPELLEKPEEWQSLNMNVHEPVIERMFIVIDNYRLCLNKIYRSDADLLFHNHSWPFAIKLFYGEYEMGVGVSRDGTKPEITAELIIKAGMSYDMSNVNIWHYTKALTEYTYSVMLIDDSGRWRPQSCVFDGLSEEKQKEILSFFKQELSKNEVSS